MADMFPMLEHIADVTATAAINNNMDMLDFETMVCLTIERLKDYYGVDGRLIAKNIYDKVDEAYTFAEKIMGMGIKEVK